MNRAISIPFLIFIVFSSCILYSCNKDRPDSLSYLDGLGQTTYFEEEVFAPSDIKIYGLWQVFDISSGIHGGGYEVNFDYLEIKEFGIYGFVRNETLLEYGKIGPALQTAYEIGLKVDFEMDVTSNSFFEDREKYVEFSGKDTLHLYSPCCDRYNYHFKRVR
jgi:hypothetical protein